MTSHRFEAVLPDAALFLALVRGRVVAPDVPSLDAAIPAAAARAMSRESLAEAIVPRLRTLGAPAESIAAAERLRVPGTVCVVAGQQPVLFGGPHFIVTKALATVALARRIEASGTPCVPVFWVASEDHDHAEVDHVDVGRRGDDAVRLTVPLPGDRRMLSRVTMPPETADVVAQLATLLPAGPGRDDALAAVSPWAGDTVGAAFARTMLHLCGRFGLVVVEPDALRTHAREVIDHELAHPGELAATIAAVEDSFAARGFTRPLALRHRQLFFVVDREGKRHVPQGLPAPGDAKALASWRKRLAEQPERFSWNVAGRVLAQDVALPVAAQVCGPSEFGYCATLGAAHARLGVAAPALVARPGVTFAESEGDAPDASQERKLSILPFLARRGSGMLDDMLEAISRPDVEHEVVRLGGA